MSNHKKGQSTGPITQDGKSVSSKNARKDAIFVKGYLPWEDQISKQQEFEALIKQWDANDPTRLILIRSIEQATLSMDRLMYAQAKKILGLEQSVHIARDFCERTGMPLLSAISIPKWFFLGIDNQDKEYAIHLAKIYDEAENLKSSYSDQLMARANTDYPNLYAFVMKGYKQGSSFVGVLGHRFGQSSPVMNLAKLINEIKDKFPYHFIWAEAPERYQMVIDGLRAEQMEQAMDFEKTNRYATNIQNRIAKAFASLVALDHYERQLRTTEPLINHEILPVLSQNKHTSETKEGTK